jgi:hypothetical protein
LPFASGAWFEQTGGVFFATVQLFVTVLPPLAIVATRVLLPAASWLEGSDSELLVPPMATPLIAQVVVQATLLGVTVNEVVAKALAGTVSDDAEGSEPTNWQPP